LARIKIDCSVSPWQNGADFVILVKPMNKTYYLWTLGCQMNKSDAERIAAILNDLGYRSSSFEAAADLIVVVACSVRQSAIDRIYGRSRQWQARRQQGRLVTVLTGCVLASDQEKLKHKFDLLLPIKNIVQLPKLLADLKPLATKDYFQLEPAASRSYSALVPIMTGCNNFCAYCVVPYSRGREISRPAQEVIDECRQLIKRGVKEIVLLGQNVNSYHSSFAGQQYDFSELLKAIDAINGDYWLRFITSHPKDLSDQLIAVMADSRHLTPYLHLALQSGDDAILKAMNRQYTAPHYWELVKRARQAIPRLMISTDIIVGFPGETKSQFNQTAKLMKKIGFDMAYIAKYSARPGTAAARLKDTVSLEEKKRRAKELTDILKQSAETANRKLIGATTRVLVERCVNGRCQGKNEQFKTVVFSGPRRLVGQFVEVVIEEADSWGLRGAVVAPRVVVVLGPTACGKTRLAVRLASQFNGEIISADSRQVYRGMDIGTGKDLADYQLGDHTIPYHLIDVVGPQTDFNVAKYQKLAYRQIAEVLARGKTPFLVGGSGLYLDAVIDGYQLPQLAKNSAKIREALNQRSLPQLVADLKKVDLASYRQIDKKNRRRVQRALEIYYQTGQPKSGQINKVKPDYQWLVIGIKFPLEEIYRRIARRLRVRLKQGMIEEVSQLKANGLSWKRLDDFGLEYRWIARYLRGLIDYPTMLAELEKAIRHFAKRQLTWFKRRDDIHWVTNFRQAKKLTQIFLNKK